MNKILELKQKPFTQKSKTSFGSSFAMNNSHKVTVEHIENLIQNLKNVIYYWAKKQKLFDGILITVYYNKIVAKSNRINGLFKGQNSNLCIVGNRFNKEKNKHITTYLLEVSDLEKSIKDLEAVAEILNKYFNGQLDSQLFKKIDEFENIITKTISISKFKNIISDVSYIEEFDVLEAKQSDAKNNNIITFYDVKKDIKDILKSFKINIYSGSLIDENTVIVDHNQARTIFSEIPYLVSMSYKDQENIFEDKKTMPDRNILKTIKKPRNEPIIGVLDTLFDKNVYFNEWVETEEKAGLNISKNTNDYDHGTKVCSIIVDGPALNPKLDDGCGNFRVKHFGIATGAKFSPSLVAKNIKDIVLSNPDIKVWNLSLGSTSEIEENSISPIAAILDDLQSKKDVIFVVSGTNKNPDDNTEKKIGSPADSINSIVVNSVSQTNEPTSYSRKGIVLSFFAKPDVSYYGGDKNNPITTCGPLGESKVMGTSFAAPWITRKIAYLIHIIGLKREAAKALIIDSARGWNSNPSPKEIELKGHGVVPIKIQDILQTPKDQIKFIVNDESIEWNTYNFSFPVPREKDSQTYAYRAKATMAYFPICNKSQGVDYTNTELNISFGRITKSNNIKSINNNVQNIDEDENHYLYEKEARTLFRKWDNVKYISEKRSEKARLKKSYGVGKWGMSITKTNRLNKEDGKNLKFSVVVTLENIYGKNRIEEFRQSCIADGWLANFIDIENKLNLYEKLDEKLNLE